MRQSPSSLVMPLPALLAAATAHAQPREAAGPWRREPPYLPDGALVG